MTLILFDGYESKRRLHLNNLSSKREESSVYIDVKTETSQSDFSHPSEIFFSYQDHPIGVGMNMKFAAPLLPQY